MKMKLSKILGGLLLLTAFFNCPAQAQAVADEPKRHEGEIWFDPTKMEVGGQAYEGERGHLMVRENRKKPNSNLIELVSFGSRVSRTSQVTQQFTSMVGPVRLRQILPTSLNTCAPFRNCAK